MTLTGFIIGAFAVSRATRMIVEDTLFDGVRDRVFACLHGRRSRVASLLSDLLACQWCVGVHVAGWGLLVACAVGVVPFTWSSSGVVEFVAWWLALAGGQSMIYGISNR